jgi:ubiquitin C-terminal hydrolase
MSGVNERNQEYVESINKDKKEYLNFFVTEFQEELDYLERLLETESSQILLKWVSDKLHKLQEDYDADL